MLLTHNLRHKFPGGISLIGAGSVGGDGFGFFRQAERGCCKMKVEQQPSFLWKSIQNAAFWRIGVENQAVYWKIRYSKAGLRKKEKPGFLNFQNIVKIYFFFNGEKCLFSRLCCSLANTFSGCRPGTAKTAPEKYLSFPAQGNTSTCCCFSEPQRPLYLNRVIHPKQGFSFGSQLPVGLYSAL